MIGLNYRDSRPIYEQIKDNFRRLILSGGIGPDERLPSVRELASQLAINPNTIQRAYREMESEGLIYTVPGKGSFAGRQQEVHTVRINQLLAQLDSIVDQLATLGVDRQDLIERITEKGGEDNDRAEGSDKNL